MALDLSGLCAVDDTLSPALLALTRLEVLQLSHTCISDATVDALTYGQRLHAHMQQQLQVQAVAGTAQQASQPGVLLQQWPR